MRRVWKHGECGVCTSLGVGSGTFNHTIVRFTMDKSFKHYCAKSCAKKYQLFTTGYNNKSDILGIALAIVIISLTPLFHRIVCHCTKIASVISKLFRLQFPPGKTMIYCIIVNCLIRLIRIKK